jgi:hypothetical protein
VSPPVHNNSPEPQSPDKQQSRTNRFKEMLATADSEEEQILALQIALSERIRQLRSQGSNHKSIQQLERASELLRDGSIEEAIKCIST